MRRSGSSPFPALRRLAALATASVALIGCGGPCEELRAWVCDGRGEDYCVQVDAFLAERQVDGDGKTLEGAAREESCRMIVSNVELKHAYRFKAKEKLLGEPYFEVAKNRKPSDEASEGEAEDKKAPASAAAKK